MKSILVVFGFVLALNILPLRADDPTPVDQALAKFDSDKNQTIKLMNTNIETITQLTTDLNTSFYKAVDTCKTELKKAYDNFGNKNNLFSFDPDCLKSYEQKLDKALDFKVKDIELDYQKVFKNLEREINDYISDWNILFVNVHAKFYEAGLCVKGDNDKCVHDLEDAAKIGDLKKQITDNTKLVTDEVKKLTPAGGCKFSGDFIDYLNKVKEQLQSCTTV